VVKAPPTTKKKNDLKSQLDVATTFASKNPNAASPKLKENITRLRELIQILLKSGQVREDDGFSSLIKEAVHEMSHSEARLRKTEEDLKRLQTVLQSILEHNKFLQDQFGAYKEYLENVRQSCGSVSVKKTKKTAEAPKKEAPKSASNAPKEKPKKMQFKISHAQLEKEGVIMTSDVPEDRKSGISFTFKSTGGPQIEVDVDYKSRHVASLSINIDELLEKQQNNELELETEFLKLNVNLLLFLLNKNFGTS